MRATFAWFHMTMCCPRCKNIVPLNKDSGANRDSFTTPLGEFYRFAQHFNPTTGQSCSNSGEHPKM